MQNTQQLLYKFRALSDSSQESILAFLNELWEKEKQNKPTKKRGALGSWQGKIKIADDFDAPLEDLKTTSKNLSQLNSD